MTREFVIVLGMLVLYFCSLLGMATAWIYYRKYRKTPEIKRKKS